MAADDSAMDVDRPHTNGAVRRVNIEFVTLGMFIIGASL